jgi:uncharacterized membrane protein YhiD involved in acid resistance
MQTLLNYGFEQIEWQVALLSFLVALVLATIIALVYEKTYQGLSYSRNLVQSMILGSLVSCLLMIAIGDNIARGIGIVGSLAIIRFRSNLRDPRDLIFLFASLGVGVASGVQSYSTGIIGALIFCSAAYLLSISPFGRRFRQDGLLRFQVPSEPQTTDMIRQVLQQHTRRFVLVTIRDISQGLMFEYAYQVKLKSAGDELPLIAALEKVSGISGISYTNQEATVEV